MPVNIIRCGLKQAQIQPIFTMKKLILSLLLLCSFSWMQAQISDEDYKSLLPHVKAENWKKAFNASEELLEDAEEDNAENTENAALVRFTYLYAASGMVKDGKMKFEKLQSLVEKNKGKTILSPNFIASMNPQNTLNKTMFTNFDGLNKGFTIVTNKVGSILFYIEYDIKHKIDPKELHGTMVSCGGKINEIEVNPQKKTDWIFKMKVAEATIK